MSDQKIMNDQRITDRLQAYWDKIRGKRLIPNERDIDPDSIRDIWDHCFLVHRTKHSSGESYYYDYLGPQIIEALGIEHVNTDVKALIYPATGKVSEKFRAVFETKKSLADESEFTNQQHMQVRYRQLLLPVLNASGEVGYILGGMRWKYS